ncbi:MAG TPA: hypothetical protein VM532_06125 [Burkholderiales bacterium]|nr:hypothetical protein [Burkholderiales bacterium]
MKLNDILILAALTIRGVSASKKPDVSLSEGPFPLTREDYLVDKQKSEALLHKVSEFLDITMGMKNPEFPPTKYEVNSGNPLGIAVLPGSGILLGTLPDSVCANAGDPSPALQEHIDKDVNAIHEQLKQEKKPLGVRTSLFTDPDHFNNPLNKPILKDSLGSGDGDAFYTDGHPIRASQGMMLTAECDTFGNSDAAQYLPFSPEVNRNGELLINLMMFRRDLIETGLLFSVPHEFCHRIISGHPSEKMKFDPESEEDMALLRSMCDPSGELTSALTYPEHCLVLPELSFDSNNIQVIADRGDGTSEVQLSKESSAFKLFANGRSGKIGIAELAAIDEAMNPQNSVEVRKEAVLRIFESAKIEWRLAKKGLEVLINTKEEAFQNAMNPADREDKPDITKMDPEPPKKEAVEKETKAALETERQAHQKEQWTEKLKQIELTFGATLAAVIGSVSLLGVVRLLNNNLTALRERTKVTDETRLAEKGLNKEDIRPAKINDSLSRAIVEFDGGDFIYSLNMKKNREGARYVRVPGNVVENAHRIEQARNEINNPDKGYGKGFTITKELTAPSRSSAHEVTTGQRKGSKR